MNSIQGLNFIGHVTNNVLPKLKDKKEKDMFSVMAKFISSMGLSAFEYGPQEMIEIAKESDDKKIKSYSEEQWLNFLSFSMIAKYMEATIIKINAISLRKKYAELARRQNITTSDAKALQVLKETVDEARKYEDNSVVHTSYYYPPRYKDDNKIISEAEKKQKKQAILNVVDYLSVDSDYFETQEELRQEIEKEKIVKAKIDSTNVEVDKSNDSLFEQLKQLELEDK